MLSEAAKFFAPLVMWYTFAHYGTGPSLETALVVINPNDTPVVAKVTFHCGEEVTGGNIEIPSRLSRRIAFKSKTLISGWLEIHSNLPIFCTLLYQQNGRETSVAPAEPIRQLWADYEGGELALAVANPGEKPTRVDLRLTKRDGTTALLHIGLVTLGPGQHDAFALDLPCPGTLLIEASEPVLFLLLRTYQGGL